MLTTTGSSKRFPILTSGFFCATLALAAIAPPSAATAQPEVERKAQYVALGDSFQAGEGSFQYLAGTDTATNKCHRSATAYPHQLVASGAVTAELNFWACSGSTVASLRTKAVNDSAAPWNDPAHPATSTGGQLPAQSALDRLSLNTHLVTVGVGGNDVGFSSILMGCLRDSMAGPAECKETYNDVFTQRLDRAVAEGLWLSLFFEIKSRAPLATVVAVGYPMFFPEHGASAPCYGISPEDQQWINDGTRAVNEAIKTAATSLNIDYVELGSTSSGNELCSGASEQFFHGVLVDASGVRSESFHPTPAGHARMTTAIAAHLNNTGHPTNYVE